MLFSDPGKGRIIFDSGRGTEPEKVTLAEDCSCGDVLGRHFRCRLLKRFERGNRGRSEGFPREQPRRFERVIGGIGGA